MATIVAASRDNYHFVLLVHHFESVIDDFDNFDGYQTGVENFLIIEAENSF